VTARASIVAVACVAVLGIGVTPAAAQARRDHGWVSVSAGMQFPTASSFSDTFDIDAFVETGHATVKYPIKNAPVFGGSFGVRVWRQLGIGIGATHVSKRGDAEISASIPHPFFDDKFRDISGTTGASRDETGVHLQVALLVPTPPRWRVMVTAGPSYLDVSQTLATDVQYAQSYPYDTATLTGATTRSAHKGAVGFNAGADVAWMFSRNVGAGGMVQFSRATVKLDAGSGRTVSIDAGGAQVGAGLRFVF
jgi:hypothetical protein